MVFATVNVVLWSPRIAVQRIRLWESVVATSQAALALKTPLGTCSRPAPSLSLDPPYL